LLPNRVQCILHILEDVRCLRGDRLRTGLGGILHPLRDREDRGVDLRVEVEERLLRGRVEPGQGQADRLLLVVEDGERLAHLLQAAGGDDVIQSTLLEAQADRFRPLGEVLGELLVLLAERLHLADDDARFDGAIRVVLLKPVREAVKVRFVQAASANETVGLTLALGVGRGDHVEADGGLDVHPDLLDVDALALKHGLKAHHALRPKVNLVQQEDRATLHGLNHATEHELGLAVDEAEATDEVILVRFGGDVDAHQFPSGRRANLFDHGGLAVAAHARDVDGRELLGGEDGVDVLVVAPRNERVVLGGDEGNIGGRHDEVVGVAVHVAHCTRKFCGVKGCVKVFRNIFGVVGFDAVHGNGDHLRDMVLPTTCAAIGGLHKPSRENRVGFPALLHTDGECIQALIASVDGISHALGFSIEVGECLEELLLAVVDVAVHAPILHHGLNLSRSKERFFGG